MAKKKDARQKRGPAEGGKGNRKGKVEPKRREPPSLLYPVVAIGVVAAGALFFNWLELLGRNAT
ncbi:MAG TPA: hypothetical protein ENF73_04680, partial [Proteobacteria bacterium]|nr:hypothetical protein [Pseudomonadota bacterium]